MHSDGQCNGCKPCSCELHDMMIDIPCAVEVEGARAADGDEAEDVAVEAEGALEAPAHHGDVVQRSQRQPAGALNWLHALGVHHLLVPNRRTNVLRWALARARADAA